MPEVLCNVLRKYYSAFVFCAFFEILKNVIRNKGKNMFSNLFKRNKKENKALLEHKLYLAKETPELIFELSGCDLNNVPTGVYSLCKVFRKQVLDLSINQLQSLMGGGNLTDLNNIVVLNLNSNYFTTLPCDINLLYSLKELHLESNQLKKLPLTICTLKNLETLNVNNNNLQELPSDLGLLPMLKVLWIKQNPKLLMLPTSLHKAHKLSDIQLDEDSITYPPGEILKGGVNSIREFICKDNNCNCFETQNGDTTDSKATIETDTEVSSSYNSHIEAKIWNLEKLKVQKQKDFLAIEREWDALRQQEIEIANSQKRDREKLLAQLIQQQGQFDCSLDKLQQVKDEERFRLVEQLKETENAAGQAIQQLLQLNVKPPAELFEQEMRDHEELLKTANEHKDIRKTQILNEMTEMLENERNKFKQMDQNRIETTKTILNQEIESNCHIMEVLESIDNRSKELTDTLNEDDQLQKMAVAALLEKSDVRSWSLVQQVMLVEGQLANLTTIELDRRRLQVDHNLNDLAQQRVELSNVLLDLLDQQNARRCELFSTLQDLERMNEDNTVDFWIRQYQALLDRTPEGLAEMQKKFSPHFVELLLMEGVLNYLPLLARLTHNDKSLVLTSDEDLHNLGITNPRDRLRILSALDKYSHYSDSKGTAPTSTDEDASAPEAEIEATAPTAINQNIGAAEVECVICMDEQCQVVYIPCGHFCSCYDCSIAIEDCPMCRAKITRIIKVNQ